MASPIARAATVNRVSDDDVAGQLDAVVRALVEAM
jgi:hypothetical protein